MMKEIANILTVALGLSLGDATSLRGARELLWTWQPPFLDAYKAAFPDKKFMNCHVFLEDQGIVPETGTHCHKRVKAGPYSCFYGEQDCESDAFPFTVHPAKICDCDIVTGLLTCDETWTPCKAAPEVAVDPEPIIDTAPEMAVDPEPIIDTTPETRPELMGDPVPVLPPDGSTPIIDTTLQTMTPLAFTNQDTILTPQNTVMTPPPFGSPGSSILGDAATPNFDGTWDGSLDLDASLGQTGTDPPGLGIANDQDGGNSGVLTLPGDAPVTRTNWPEVVGDSCATAAALISQAPNVGEVYCIADGDMFTFDWVPNRVRIYYDPATYPEELVNKIPMLG